MAYSGTTAGSTSANPPVELVGAVGGVIANAAPAPTGAKIWFYTSTSAFTDIVGSSASAYFTDGAALGMKAGDVVVGVCAAATAMSSAYAYVGVIGGVNASSGAWVSSGPVWST